MLFRLANSGRFCYGREEMGGDRREWYGMEGNRRGERESKGGNLRGMDGNESEGMGGNRRGGEGRGGNERE